MNNCCGKCFDEWYCSWCKKKYCDDICSPRLFEGKPRHWNAFFDVDKNHWNFLTETQKKKMINKNSQQITKTFYLCKNCKDNYIKKIFVKKDIILN